ncbi:MAG: TPM domain-containing protein, partial [bacterium]
PIKAAAAFPAPTGFVNDFAGVISPATRQHLEGMLSSFERASGNEIAVATIPSLDGGSVEDVAVGLYKAWGIGKKSKDNGVLFLIVPNEHKMRIEVGYGLEGSINDALAGRIMDEAVIPRFKSGDMDAGIAAGVLAIVKTISSKEGLAFDADAAMGGSDSYETQASDNTRKRSVPGTIFKIIVFLLLAYLFIRHPWLFLIFLSSMGRGGGGGGFSGGFGGFGGGLSGGGGASRGW